MGPAPASETFPVAMAAPAAGAPARSRPAPGELATEPAGGGDSVRSRLLLAAADIKLAHSVFALPFAVLAAFLAREPVPGWGRFAGQLALVVVCMVLARTWAMLINRLADRDLDAANPRTARRVIASGRLPARSAAAMAWGAAALFVLAACAFGPLFGNPYPGALAGPVLALLALYSYTKRWTWACHLVLGIALAASPLAAALAIRPGALADAPALWWLAGMVTLWVAGFDVVYAMQDIDFDRGRGLRSIPARLGVRGAAWASRALHLGAVGCLLLAGRAEPRLGALYWVGVGGVVALLLAEHAIVALRRRPGLEAVYFTLNGVVSCVLGTAGVLDVVLAG